MTLREAPVKVAPAENNKEKSGFSALFVISIALLLTVVFSVVIFLFHMGGFKLPFGDKHGRKSLQELYDEGLPEIGLKKLDKLSTSERNQAENMLWRGKLAYLATWKQYNDSAWDGYAKNEKDWFTSEVLDDGIQALNQCLKSEKTKHEAQLFLGLIYLEKGQYNKAEFYLKKLLKEKPTHGQGILNYAIIQSRKGNYVKAAQILENGLEHDPKNTYFLKNLFWLYNYHLSLFDRKVELLTSKGIKTIALKPYEKIDFFPSKKRYHNSEYWVLANLMTAANGSGKTVSGYIKASERMHGFLEHGPYSVHNWERGDKEKAIDYANRFLLHMKKGDPDKTKVIRELRNIISNFPEYDSDTLVIHENEPPEFKPRKSAERMRMRNRQKR